MNIFLRRGLQMLALYLLPATTFAQLVEGGSETQRSLGQRWVPVLTEEKNGVKSPKAIKGDFVVTGNTLMKEINGDIWKNNGLATHMVYVNSEPGLGWLNSSSAELRLIDNNSKNLPYDDCTQIIYAGLYWTGRDMGEDKNGAAFNKIKLKSPKGNQQEVVATHYFRNPIYATGSAYKEYTCYADVTEFVKNGGVGSYTAGNMKTADTTASELTGSYVVDTVTETTSVEVLFFLDPTTNVYRYWSNYHNGYYPYLGEVPQSIWQNGAYAYRGTYAGYNVYIYRATVQAPVQIKNDGLGLFGGWKLVVVYENESLKPKAFAFYDGMEHINLTNNDKEIKVEGFITPSSGNIDSKFSFLVTEGDYVRTGNDGLASNFFSGDVMSFIDKGLNASAGTASEVEYERRNTQLGNTFDGTINLATTTIKREERFNKNWGIDIEYDPNFLKNNGLLYNNQKDFSVSFKTTGDVYWLNNFNIAIDTYLPEPFSVGSYVGEAAELLPGDEATFRVDVFNYGNEDIVNGAMYFPIPQAVDFELVTAVPTRGEVFIVKDSFVPAGQGGNKIETPNGYIKWDMSSFELPTTNKEKNLSQEPIATLVYKVRIAKDCDKLRLLCKDKPIAVKMEGFMRGAGKYSHLPITNGGKIETNIQGATVNPCKYVPTVEKNNVKVNQVGMECSENGVNTIQLCEGENYERVPDYNLSYVDETNENTAIVYQWNIKEYDESQIKRTIKKQTDSQGVTQYITTKMELIDGAQGTPVDLGFGTEGVWTTNTDGITFDGKSYPFAEKGYINNAAATVKKVSYQKPCNIFLIELTAAKIQKDDLGGWSNVCGYIKDYTEIKVTEVPKKTIAFSPTTIAQSCVSDQEIRIISPDNENKAYLDHADQSVMLKISYYWHEVDASGNKLQGGLRFPRSESDYYEVDLIGGAQGAPVTKYPEMQENEHIYKLYVHYVSNGRCGVETIEDATRMDYSYGPVPVQGSPKTATVETTDGGFFVTPVQGADYSTEYLLQYLDVKTETTSITVPKVDENGRIVNVTENAVKILSQEYKNFRFSSDGNFTVDGLNGSVSETYTKIDGTTLVDASTGQTITEVSNNKWFIPLPNKTGKYKIIVRAKEKGAQCPSEVQAEKDFTEPVPAFINPALIHWIKRD